MSKFSLSPRLAVYLVIVTLAPHRTVNQFQVPTLLSIPNFSESSYFYLFDSANMSSTLAPAAAIAIPAILEHVASIVCNHMAAIANGGVAGEEEYQMWGQEFMKRMVHYDILFLICLND